MVRFVKCIDASIDGLTQGVVYELLELEEDYFGENYVRIKHNDKGETAIYVASRFIPDEIASVRSTLKLYGVKV